MLMGATLSAFIYFLAVIFLPEYFTYNGTTSILMSINFIFLTLLLFLKTEPNVRGRDDNDRYINTKIVAETLVEDKMFTREEGGDQRRKLRTILDNIMIKNKEYL
jgi:hypothetical protein